MNKIEKILLAAALILGVIGVFTPIAQVGFGGVTNFDSL